MLAALAETGGLPGSDAEDEVVILRGYAGESLAGLQHDWNAGIATGRKRGKEVRIPLRLPPGSADPFKPEDIALRDGDIVFIEARDTEFYYTGGLLPSIEVPVPARLRFGRRGSGRPNRRHPGPRREQCQQPDGQQRERRWRWQAAASADRWAVPRPAY